MRSFHTLSLLVLILLVLSASRARGAQPSQRLAVFPGAVGYGVDTPAGRGGKIITVTSLAGEGPGSLRQALETKGPRTIVFEVGGVIDLAGKDLVLDEPFVTVAGQTAPPPGITLMGGALRPRSHDMLIQHLRVRPGDMGKPKKSGWEPDGIALGNAPGTPGCRNIVIDHCSATWAVDENLSASGPRHEGREGTSNNITFSNCIIAEGLNDSTHAKGPHSMGTLIHDHARNVAIIGNLYASNMNRNPVLKPDAAAVVANNLIYNPGVKAIHSYWSVNEYTQHMDRLKPPTLVAVGNVLWHGPDTPANLPLIVLAADKGEVFAEGNITRDRNGKPTAEIGGKPTILKDRPFWPAGFTAMPADKVAEHVLATAGAWPRDAIDQRIVEQTRKGTGKIIDSQEQVGGYPKIQPTKHTLDLPKDPNGDADGDGYTNLEAWLHALARKAQTGK